MEGQPEVAGGHDAPIQTAADDLLDGLGVARAMHRFLSTTPSSWSTRIGLFGRWGSGKTSILNLLRTLEEADGALVVSFSAWSASGESGVIAQFYETLAARLREERIELPKAQRAKRLPSPEHFRQGDQRNAVLEDIPTSLRRPVVEASAELLRDWPGNFLSFAKTVGLRQHHFSQCTRVPVWMREEIAARLALRNRTLTAEHVHQAVAELQEQGKPTTRTAIQRFLGGYTKSIKELICRRVTASSEEFEVLVRVLSVQLSARSKKQRRSRYTFFRSRALIGVSIVCRLPLDKAVHVSVTQLTEFCRNKAGLTAHGESLRLLSIQWLDEAMRLAGETWGARSDLPFVGFAASNTVSGARCLLAQAMKGAIDSRLRVGTEVFFDVASHRIEDAASVRR